MSACRRDKRTSSANDAKRYTGALSRAGGAPAACWARKDGQPVRDVAFLTMFAASLVIGAHVYALTGWAMPGLIDKGD